VSFDMLDYILSLREGIMDAWGGILLAFKETPKGMSKGITRSTERC
jgi:importin subunit beta-1